MQYPVPKLTPLPADTRSNTALLPHPIPDEEEEISLLDYWLILKRHKWGILAFVLLGFFIAFLIAFNAQPLYKSRVRLIAEPVMQRVADQVGPYQSVNTAWVFYKTQYELIASRAIAEKVIRQLDLVHNPTFTGANRKKLFELPKIDWRAWIPKAWLPETPEKEGAEIREMDPLAPYVDLLLSNLKVTGDEESAVITVEYTAPDPVLAAQIANAIAQAYIQFSVESRMETTQAATQWLKDQLKEVRNKLKASEEALQRFQAQENLIDTENSQRIAATKLASLSAELVRAQAQRSELEVRYRQVKAILDSGTSLESVSSVLNNRVIEQLKAQLVQRLQAVREMSERYGPKHPKMIAANSALEEARKALRQEIDKIAANLRKELEVARAREQELKRLIADQENAIIRYQDKSFKLAQLERDVQTQRELYENLLEKARQLEAQHNYNLPNITVIEKAHPALKPFKPKKAQILFVGSVLGGFLGVLIAFLREYLDNTVKTEEDVEKKIGVPLLGVTPLLDNKELHGSPPECVYRSGQPHKFVEAINYIRTGVLFSNLDRPPQTIMITSSVPNEGKTTLACNLAMAFAKLDTTLLLETDLRKPRLGELITKAPKGLTEVLLGEARLEEVLVQDKQEGNLYYLAAGMTPPHPLEALSSHAFQELVAKLKQRFAHIVFDTPPINAVSDPLVIARLSDAIAMVVKADDTPINSVMAALKRLQTVEKRPTGIILNQLDLEKAAYYGYHGYYGGTYGDYQYARITPSGSA
ncbi:polysaccharide biosynthesis transport protein [Methylomarinovum tepidoasis]|uniref:Polysaccharide biosynthesis transport protein n=1 Tax=Methylomarinovum tepidoasis TaxID=2840183 RepID=A0AAU9C7G0_9GAMM|nr:polysaccharide biosynthesis tyrosine autokinase [Methylomarinovum sp. IN45]BCX87752.1 polysaccharide biosynthesis transport protein [Methylomarinovum sp. IN45]